MMNGDPLLIDDIPTGVRVLILLSLEAAWDAGELTGEEYDAASKWMVFQEAG